MQVNLIKEADFDFKAEKYSNIPFETFCNLAEMDKENLTKTKKPELEQAQLFENIADFRKKYEPGVFNEEKGVFVLPSGKIVMFLKQLETPTTKTHSDTQGTNADNESTNSKENPAKKA